MPRPLMLTALKTGGKAVILLIVVVGARDQGPGEQTARGADLPIRPVYWLVAQSNFSSVPLSGPQLCELSSGIERELGRERCRKALQSQAELEKSIESDGQQEALYVETELQGPKPKVTLWAEGKDHHTGKIADFPCEGTRAERCVELALRDFPADISTHDETCHRGKQCRADSRMFIVP